MTQHPAALIRNNNNKSLDPLRAKKTFNIKKLGHTMVSVIKASSVTLSIWQKVPDFALPNGYYICIFLFEVFITKAVSQKNLILANIKNGLI